MFQFVSSQNKQTFFNGCVSEKKANLINEMVSSFETQLCHFYKIDKKKSHLAFQKYVNDIHSDSENFKKITVKKENHLLKKSKEVLLDYIWITNKEKRDVSNTIAGIVDESMILFDDKKIEKEYKEHQKKTENILSVNYFNKFSNCLIKNTKSQDLKDIIETIKEVPDVLPTSVSSAIAYSEEDNFKDYALQAFISFELYYTVLNSLSKK